jgi:hypothetical protein
VQGRQFLDTFSQRLESPLLFLRDPSLAAPEMLLLQDASHRLSQAHQPVLSQIIGRPHLHAFDGCLFVTGPAYDDERDVQPTVQHDLQSAVCIELRPWIICQDEVGSLREARDIVLLRLNPLPGWHETSPAQLEHHQFGVFRPILEDQNAKWGFHPMLLRALNIAD